MVSTEDIIRTLGLALGVKLLGTNTPDRLNLQEDFDNTLFGKLFTRVTEYLTDNILPDTGNIFSLSDFNNSWADTLNNIFSKDSLLSDLNILGSDKWNDIFSKSALLSDLAGLGSTKWPDIFSLSSLSSSLGLGTTFDFSQWFTNSNLIKLVKVWLTAFLNMLSSAGSGDWLHLPTFEYNYSTDEFEVIWATDYNHNTDFSLEAVIYNVIAKFRNAVISALSQFTDWMDDILPEEIDFWIPLFSGAGIHIASKIDDVRTLDDEDPWPETWDPDVFRLYFSIPMPSIIIPIVDISENNVTFYGDGTYNESRKYNTRDLFIDILVPVCLTLLTYVLSRMGMSKYVDSVTRNVMKQTSQVTTAAKNAQNTIIINKNIFASMASIMMLINHLIGAAANTNAIQNILDDFEIDYELPDFSEFTGISDELDTVYTNLSNMISTLSTEDLSSIMTILRRIQQAIGLKLAL